MLFVVIIGGAVIFGAICGALFYDDTKKRVVDHPESRHACSGYVASVFFVIALVTSGIIAPSVVFTNIGAANDLDAFYYSNATVHTDAVERIAAGVNPTLTEGMLLDAASLKQVEGFAFAVKDRRDDIIRFNRRLKTHLYWQDHGLVGFMIRNVGEDVTFITGD